MRDLSHPAWIKIKGMLFLLLGLLASLLLWLERPTFKVELLLMVAVWSFCRFYYFAFYVIERYVDSSYRYSGMISMVRYLMRRRAVESGNTATGGNRGNFRQPDADSSH